MAANSEQPAAYLLTLQEVSETLRVSKSTVRRMIDRRELRAVRVGSQIRVPRNWLIAYLKSGRIS